MRFAGYEVEESRLSRTAAMQKTHESIALGNSGRPRVCGLVLPVIKTGLHRCPGLRFFS